MYSHAHTIGIIILYINCRSGEDIYKLIFARYEDRQKVGKCTIILLYSLCRDGPEKTWPPYISIANGKLKSLVIYTNKLKYT